MLLAEGFEMFEASAFIDVMGWNLTEGDKSTELVTCSLRKEIKSSFDQKFTVDYLIDQIDVDSFDALAIPGGFEIYGFYEDAYSKEFSELIRLFKAKDKIIASICVGALLIGKSGILKGKKGTIYNSTIRREALRDFGVEVIDLPIVVDDNIITSHNPSTAIGVALLLLEYLTSKKNATCIRKLMGFAEK